MSFKDERESESQPLSSQGDTIAAGGGGEGGGREFLMSRASATITRKRK